MAAAPILVLGMHRSGTSCLAGSLQQCGLHLGEVYESRPHNRKGSRENQQVMDLNDAVLASSGGAWDDPPEALRWDRAAALARDGIVARLRDGAAGAPWGFKDPRTLLTLPFWLEAIPDARLVGTFRHPLRVARSLRARDARMPLEAGTALWANYNERLLALHVATPFPIVSFDAAAGEYPATVGRLASHLRLAAPPAEGIFFEDALRHQVDDAPQPALQALHDALMDAARRWDA